MTGDHEGYQYFYDYENRLTEIQDDEDNPVAKYEYDALGRRIQKIEYATGGNVTTRYYYDGWRVLAETNENDLVQREYVYGNYLDEVLVMTDTDDHYYAHDHLFSPVALIDDDGNILERYEYDAYGKCTFLDDSFNPLGTQASGHGNTRLFTGQVLDILDDGDFLIMYYKNRYYDPETGRFITTDPIGMNDGLALFYFKNISIPISKRFSFLKQYSDGMNLFEYVRSQPIVGPDIYGLQYHPIIPAGPGFHLAKKTQKPKCGVCGPDITNVLQNLGCSTVVFFNKQFKTEKARLCKKKDSIWGWDVFQLVSYNFPLDPKYARCGTGDCGHTVMVAGHCYHSGGVNYFIYGVMAYLCQEFKSGQDPYNIDATETSEYTKIQLYTPGASALAIIPFLGSTANPGCKKAWFRAGYNGDLSGPKKGCPNMSYCTNCPAGRVTRLSGNWDNRGLEGK